MTMNGLFKKNIFITAILTLGLAACGNGGEGEAAREPAGLMITGVNVIDMETGAITPDQAIVVSGGGILAIQNTAEAEAAYAAAETVQADGQYAMPGLMDMHIHLRGGPDLIEENEIMLGLYLPYGVTSVRDGAGDIPDAVLAWRDEVAAGKRLAPRIYTSLRKLDGPGARWEGSIPVASPDDIGPALEAMEAAGADFIKIYDSTITPDMYLQTLARAEAMDLKTAAHLQIAVPFRAAMEAGLDSLEHALYLHKGTTPLDAEVSAQIASGELTGFRSVLNAINESYDEAYARETFRMMAERGMAVTPTAYIDRLLDYLDEEDHLDDPELSGIPAGIVETYAGRVESAARRTPEQIAAGKAFVARTLSLLPMLEEEGVMILAGSDSGAFNSYVYPGDSLHHELRMLVENGVSPLKALQGATLNAARWLGVDGRFGTLAPGKAADILLLEANPLADINATRAITGLVFRGEYLTRTELDARYEELARAAE